MANDTAFMRVANGPTGPAWGRPLIRPAGDEREQIRAAAKEFEALFLVDLLRQAREGKLAEDVLGSSEGDTFRAMFDAEIARAAGAGLNLGIADAMADQLTQRAGQGGE
jgi:flagellar protein FlgJ